ncbi:MAG: purine-nucleoside phosphorylase [Saprospiraceae bacterium]
MSLPLYERLQESAAYLRNRCNFTPHTCIILGTGLGDFGERVRVERRVPYGEIPHFAHSTVASHAGELLLGHVGNEPVAVMSGRLHYYEGWSMEQVVYPIRVMRMLGVARLIITNASGGINPHLQKGDIVVVRDHINLLPENPLRGPNDERIGPRFPDMSEPYDAALRGQALSAARRLGIRASEGVYSALQGPQLETPAEYAMLRVLGSDCTGMSSIPEALAARHAGMQVLMLSMVTNVSFPPSAVRYTTLEEVIEVAQAAGSRLSELIADILSGSR